MNPLELEENQKIHTHTHNASYNSKSQDRFTKDEWLNYAEQYARHLNCLRECLARTDVWACARAHSSQVNNPEQK